MFVNKHFLLLIFIVSNFIQSTQLFADEVTHQLWSFEKQKFDKISVSKAGKKLAFSPNNLEISLGDSIKLPVPSNKVYLSNVTRIIKSNNLNRNFPPSEIS